MTSEANKVQVGGKHYKTPFEHWDLCADLQLDYFRSAATKYIARHRSKNGREDLLKAAHYMDKLDELISTNRGQALIVSPPDRTAGWEASMLHTTRSRLVELFLGINSLTKDHEEYYLILNICLGYPGLGVRFLAYSSYGEAIRALADMLYPVHVADRAVVSSPSLGAEYGNKDLATADGAAVDEITTNERQRHHWQSEGYKANEDFYQCTQCKVHARVPKDYDMTQYTGGECRPVDACQQAATDPAYASPSYVNQDRS